ncbi:hypothetical protein [Flammeovirga sp. OC4]|uniref:hypothetical protein n=1 Tax=Flammeovirga sp. OC4 TaxID=1382345 RepID=UPI0005C465C8|nr:hypothetical protein [Flammeovirga sp. OC4]
MSNTGKQKFHLKKTKSDKDKWIRISIEFLVVLLLLSLLLKSIYYNVNIDEAKTLSVSDITAVYSFILTSIAILVSTAVFLPQFTMKRIVKDEIDIYTREIENKIKETYSKTYASETDLLKLEAHDCRMNAYYLNEQKRYIWALGWALKATDKYQELFFLEETFNVRYKSLLEDLEKITKGISENIILEILDNEKYITNKSHINKSVQDDISKRYFRYFKCKCWLYKRDKNSKSGNFNKNVFNGFRYIMENKNLESIFKYYSCELDEDKKRNILDQECFNDQKFMYVKKIEKFFKEASKENELKYMKGIKTNYHLTNEEAY